MSGNRTHKKGTKMNAKFILLSLLVGILASGCSTISAIKADDPNLSLKQEIVKFAKEDVSEALKMAVEDKDMIAAVCWHQLGQFLANIEPPPTESSEVKGAASAFQKARRLSRKIESTPELPVELRLGCSALFTDSTVLAARLRSLGR